MSSEGQAQAAEELIDSLDQGRFELYRDSKLVGWLYYTHLRPNRYALRHTEVESSHQHQGVAGAMVRRVLDEIRAREGTITAAVSRAVTGPPVACPRRRASPARR